MFNLLIPLIEEVSPFLSKIISFQSPLAKKVIHEIADYFDGSPDDQVDLSEKVKSDPQKRKKLLEVEMKIKDFEISIKTENDIN